MKGTLRLAATLLLYLFAAGGPRASDVDMPKGIRSYPEGLAPGFQLSNMDGDSFDLQQAKGSWVFVHFWASWCGPCRREMPAIQRMMDRLGDEVPVTVVLINTAEDEDTIFSFLGAIAPELDSLMDRDGQVTEAWKPRGLPATYLVDPNGILRFQALGGRPWDETTYLDFLRALSGNRDGQP